MNSLSKFVANLLPSFKRSRVQSDIRLTRGEIESLIPVYKEAAVLFSSWKFKDAGVIRKFQTFSSVVTGRDSDNPIVHISKNLEIISKNLLVIDDLAEKVLADNVVGAGMTYKQAVLVRYVDAAYLVVKYAHRLLGYVTAFEAGAFENNSLAPSDSVTPADQAWLDKHTLDFCRAYLAMLGQPEQTLQKIEEVPEIEISKSDASFVEYTQGEKTDPFRMGFIATNANPIYFVRMLVADWENKRYKENKSDVQVLELRLLQLKKLRTGQTDAKLEKQISYMEDRVQKLRAEIAEVEES